MTHRADLLHIEGMAGMVAQPCDGTLVPGGGFGGDRQSQRKGGQPGRPVHQLDPPSIPSASFCTIGRASSIRIPGRSAGL